MRHLSYLRLLVLLVFLGSVQASAQVATGAVSLQSVLTQHNDNQRSGANLNEWTLSTSNVHVASFGKLFMLPVDGHIYAQPLVVSAVNIPNKGLRDVVYVATQHNSVYAFDADTQVATQPLWHVNLGPSAPVPADFGNGNGTFADIQVEVGITSTPVINSASRTLYVVAFTKDPSDPANCSPTVACIYHHSLHALDLATGMEKFGGPVLISGSVPGTGVGGNGSQVTFNSHQQLQRSSLLLHNGVVYFAFGGYGDTDPYHGWLFGYNASTLQRVSIFNTTPDAQKTASEPHAGEGGIWMGGVGTSVDADGNLYVVSGNGSFTANTQLGVDYGDSVIQLNPAGVNNGLLPVTDWFTPYDQAIISAADNDLGSTGAMMIPGTDYLFAGGKAGILYLIDRKNLGKFSPGGPDKVVQRFSATKTSFYTSPVLWNSPLGVMVYYWEIDDVLKQLQFDGSSFVTTPLHTNNVLTLKDPGGALSISANGSVPGSAILWASVPTASADHTVVAGNLYAFDAANVENILWNSTQNAARDAVGNHTKFNAPTVANGKVFLGTTSGRLDVYGLLNQTAPGIQEIYLPVVVK